MYHHGQQGLRLAHIITFYLAGMATSPLLTLRAISRAETPSIMHPMEEQVPSTSRSVPLSSRAMDLVRFLRAISTTWSRVRLP